MLFAIAIGLAAGGAVWTLLTIIAPPAARAPAAARRSKLGRIFAASDAAAMHRLSFMGVSLVAGGGAAAVAHLSLGWPVVSAVALVTGGVVPHWVLRRRAAQRAAQFEEGLVEAIDAIRGAIGAGLSTEQAIASLALTAPDLVRPLFVQIARDVEDRIALDTALARAAQTAQHGVFDMLAVMVGDASRSGGAGLTGLLDELSEHTTETVRLLGELRARRSGELMNTTMMSAIPPALLLYIGVLQPDYGEPFASMGGQLAIGFVLGSVLLANLLARLLAREAPVQPQLLISTISTEPDP